MAPRRWLSPLRYPGGKARMADFLTCVLESQGGGIQAWIEPFAGGAGAGLALLDRGAVDEVWLTEKNPAIAAVWRAVIHHHEDLADLVAHVRPTMDLWDISRATVAEVLHGQRAVDDVELAFAALIVNRCSRSGIVHPWVGPIGGKHQSGRWRLDARWTGVRLADRIRHLGTLAPRLRIREGDGIDTIAALSGVGLDDQVLVFVDPPYLREGNTLYAQGMALTDHERLADVLNASTTRWLLTYDNEEAVTEQLYPRRRVLAYQIANTANRQRIATEYAVLSDNLTWPTHTHLLARDTTWIRETHHAPAVS